jgi:serine/threonine-protein kinase
LLSGRLPYEAVSLSELTLKQQREAPQRLEVLNPEVPRELAQAVSMALSIDAGARPPDAMVFAEALQNGLQGHAPLSDTSPTARLGTRAATEVLADRSPPTAATRVAGAQAAAPRTRQPPPRRRIEPRAAAPRPATGYPPPAAAPAARRDRGGRAMRRLVIFLAVALLFAAAVVVAVAIATSTSDTVVHARTVVGKDAQDAIDQVKSLVNQYTK